MLSDIYCTVVVWTRQSGSGWNAFRTPRQPFCRNPWASGTRDSRNGCPHRSLSFDQSEWQFSLEIIWLWVTLLLRQAKVLELASLHYIHGFHHIKDEQKHQDPSHERRVNLLLNYFGRFDSNSFLVKPKYCLNGFPTRINDTNHFLDEDFNLMLLFRLLNHYIIIISHDLEWLVRKLLPCADQSLAQYLVPLFITTCYLPDQMSGGIKMDQRNSQILNHSWWLSIVWSWIFVDWSLNDSNTLQLSLDSNLLGVHDFGRVDKSTRNRKETSHTF